MESAFWPCRLGDQLCREGNLYLLIQGVAFMRCCHLPIPHHCPPCPPKSCSQHCIAVSSSPTALVVHSITGQRAVGCARGLFFPLLVLSEGGVSWKACPLASWQSCDGYLPSEPLGGFPPPSPGLHSGEGCQSSPSLIAALHHDN